MFVLQSHPHSSASDTCHSDKGLPAREVCHMLQTNVPYGMYVARQMHVRNHSKDLGCCMEYLAFTHHESVVERRKDVRNSEHVFALAFICRSIFGTFFHRLSFRLRFLLRLSTRQTDRKANEITYAYNATQRTQYSATQISGLFG